jgi:hypothetical protein
MVETGLKRGISLSDEDQEGKQCWCNGHSELIG